MNTGFRQSLEPARAYQSSEASSSGQSDSGTTAGQDRQVSIQPRSRRQSPQYGLNTGFRQSLEQARLSHVGSSILCDGLHKKFAFGCETLEYLIPQLIYTLPSVNAAAAALGAYYELQTLPSPDNCREQLATSQYQLAIRRTRQDLLTEPHGSTALLVGCMLLSFTELLLRRRKGALLHLRGAFKILELRGKSESTVPDLTSNNFSPADDLSFRPLPVNTPFPKEAEDDLVMLFRTFDIQIASYSDNNNPNIQPAPNHAMDPSLSPADDIYGLGRHVVSAVHASYHFTSFAVSYTDLPATAVPRYLLIEQGRHIGALKHLLKVIDREVLPMMDRDTEPQPSPKHMHALMLRNLCLSTLMHTSRILDPYETSYDSHGEDFQQIVLNAETVLNSHEQGTHTMSSLSAFKFTPSLGLNHPLYMTALKYRHPLWRRRAIRCLRRTGREGPWVGELLAAVAERVAEIEEYGRESGLGSNGNESRLRPGLLDDEGTSPGTQDTGLATAIPERARICLCRSIENNGSFYGGLWLTATRGITRVKYTRRRRDVENLPVRVAAGVPPRYSSRVGNGGENPCDTELQQYFEEWHEYLQFEAGQPAKLLWSEE